MTVLGFTRFGYIELPPWYGALKILATHTARYQTQKVDLLNLQNLWAFRTLYSKALPVGDTDSNKRESCWIEPRDGVFCNVVECNDTTTSSRPAERRKVSLSQERKEKDRRKKKSPLKVLMCGLAVDRLFFAKSVQIKMHLFHHTPSEAASQLPGCCLFTE